VEGYSQNNSTNGKELIHLSEENSNAATPHIGKKQPIASAYQ